jgi:hypothetical protein
VPVKGQTESGRGRTTGLSTDSPKDRVMQPFYCKFLAPVLVPILIDVEPLVEFLVNTLHIPTHMDLLHFFAKILACDLV